MNTSDVSNAGMPTRTVYSEDALAWLERHSVFEGTSIVGSIPDISEFPKWSMAEWRAWFIRSARLCLSRTPADGLTFFYQSDIKLDGVWIDKAYFVQQAAEMEGAHQLFHKVLCRVQAGKASFGKVGYSHLLCFSKGLKATLDKSTADVVPDLGEKSWVRGMGVEACRQIAECIVAETKTRKVIHVFCGQGGMLAVANAFGLDAIGIEKSEKRSEIARRMQVNEKFTRWITGSPDRR